MTTMPKRLNHKLECPTCGTIYLTMPNDLDGDTVIHCSSCGISLGSWRELESNFKAQGGENGVFEMRDGQIIRME